MHTTTPRRILLATAATVLFLAAPAAAQAAATAAEPEIAWTYTPDGAQFCGVLARDGVVFCLDRRGHVHAVDAQTGEFRWRSEQVRSFGRGYGLALPPNESAPGLFVGCDDGFFALDRTTGRELWHTEIAAGVAGPACTGDLVVAGSGDGKIYACGATDGRERWQHDFLEDRPDDPEGFDSKSALFGPWPARPSDATTDGRIVVVPVFDQCRAIAVDASTGERRWAFATRGWVHARAAIGERNVYVASQDRHVYAVDRDSGKLNWQVETRARNEATAMPADRFVYFGSCDARVYAVDDGVGQVVWRCETAHEEGRGAPIYGRPVVLGDTVYLGAMRGEVYAIDRHRGTVRWRIEPVADSEINSDLAHADGRLFLTTRRNPIDESGTSAVVAIALPRRD